MVLVVGWIGGDCAGVIANGGMLFILSIKQDRRYLVVPVPKVGDTNFGVSDEFRS